MSEQSGPTSPAGTLPPPSPNGSTRPPPAPAAVPRLGSRTRISSMRTALIGGFLALIVLVIFIVQNAHAVQVSFLGVQVRLSLAVALLLAAIAGALLMAAAGTARITQLRRVIRRDRRRVQPQAPDAPRP
jgi:lipopolysaccharide assembly protein A